MTEMNMRLKLLVEFSREQRDEFMRPISGTGGGQQFVRRCQQLMRDNEEPADAAHRITWTLVLTGDDVEKWFRYRDDYGSGGFQSRLGRAAKQEGMFL